MGHFLNLMPQWGELEEWALRPVGWAAPGYVDSRTALRDKVVEGRGRIQLVLSLSGLSKWTVQMDLGAEDTATREYLEKGLAFPGEEDQQEGGLP